MAARNLQCDASSGCNLEETMEEAANLSTWLAVSLFPLDVLSLCVSQARLTGPSRQLRRFVAAVFFVCVCVCVENQWYWLKAEESTVGKRYYQLHS
jgi:hypothetical protein